jgi:YD repeat-containing protein
VNYTFDAADRLIQISQGSSTVQFGYDSANRRATLTLPNGIVASYSYDNASQLTGMSYSLGSSLLGNLAYGYDQSSRRTGVTGSFARTGIPNPYVQNSPTTP